MTPENKHLADPFEVMDSVLRRGDAQRLGQRMHVSAQLIRNWCRPPETEEEYTSTGRPGPLQRLGEVIDYVIIEDGSSERAHPLGHHIARRLGGVFVPLPPACRCVDSEMLRHISAVLQETSAAVEKVRVAWCEETPRAFTCRETRETTAAIQEAMGALQAMMNWVREQADK
ncbi:hypothetical protein [Desulfobulbus elongatus]|uniref:hypothetical protein n=1 Tax=Desulfobulbus elongatus TaxID=53332 RepID=UPI00047FA70F|nr:hypothetical protein [Desulfobulbus elongatus]